MNRLIFTTAAAASGTFESRIRHHVAKTRTNERGPECLVAIGLRQVQQRYDDDQNRGDYLTHGQNFQKPAYTLA